jgi:DNA (cytosine-5)-methyltransferase 1
LWENVAGALSSNHAKDFAAVLSTLVGATIPVPADGWRGGGVAAGREAVAAWRVLDLQHFGPPQRRVRVFVLAARAGGVDPAEVLALGEGVCGHPSPRGQARERIAGGVGAGVESGGVIPIGEATARQGAAHGSSAMIGQPGDEMFTLTSKQHGVFALNTSGGVPSLDAEMGTLDQRAGGSGVGAQTRGVVLAFGWQNSPAQGDSVSYAITPALDKSKTPAVLAFNCKQDGTPNDTDLSPTLTAMQFRDSHTNGGGQMAVVCTTGHVTHSLTHEGADASEDGTGRGTPIVARMVAFGTIKQRDYKDATDLVVGARPRRLTPKECERLMSWPDDHTRYGTREDGTVYELSDTARYRLCGNGVGSVQVQWIAERLAAAVRP